MECIICGKETYKDFDTCDMCYRERIEEEQSDYAYNRYYYARIDKYDKNSEWQINDACKLMRIPNENLYIDKETDKGFGREEYFKMKGKLKEGDILYIQSIHYIGWNEEVIMKEWKDICYRIEADIVQFMLPYPLTHHPHIDTTYLPRDLDFLKQYEGILSKEEIAEEINDISKTHKDRATQYLEMYFENKQIYDLMYQSLYHRVWRDFDKNEE